MLTEPRPTTRSARIVAVVRLALVSAAAAAVAAAVAINHGVAPASARRYVCPMHSEVTASHPGDCAICGMALEPVDAANPVVMPDVPAAGGAPDLALAAVRVSAEASSLLRASVAPVRRNALPGEVYAPAIVQADGTVAARLYRDELAALAPDERAALVLAASPAAPIEVRRSAGAVRPRGNLVEVVFLADAAGPALPPGQTGWVRLAYRSRDMLVVRSASVIQSPDGPYVLVFSAQQGTLARRRIEVGKDYAGMTAVVSGLRDKELVAMANTFALDAERRLQAAP
jgi:hypothetical protein